MKIRYQTGDALAGPELFVIHGCNAYGVMGSGIAAQVRKQFPGAYTEYRECFERWKKQGMRFIPLGSYTAYYDGKKTIINAITQKKFGGTPGVVYADYKAIRKFFKEFNKDIGSVHPQRSINVAMPKIGAGLAGGDWQIIAQIIEEESINFQPVVYVWEDPANSNTIQQHIRTA